MSLAVFIQLQKVFKAAEEAVIVGQLCGQFVRDDVRVLQACDGTQGVAVEDIGAARGVNELKSLDEEFDVADAAGGIFDVLSRGVSDFTGGEFTEAADRGDDGLGIV